MTEYNTYLDEFLNWHRENARGWLFGMDNGPRTNSSSFVWRLDIKEICKKNVKLKKLDPLNTKIIQFQDLVFKETFFKNNFTCLGAYLYHFSNTYFSGRWVCQKLPGQTTTYFTVKSKLCTAKQTLKLFCNSSSFWRN